MYPTFAGIVGKILTLINSSIPVLAALALLFFVFGVFKFVFTTVRGKSDAPRDIFLWGLLALLVLFFLYGIIAFIKQAFLGFLG